jgi:hypothetical protein
MDNNGWHWIMPVENANWNDTDPFPGSESLLNFMDPLYSPLIRWSIWGLSMQVN